MDCPFPAGDRQDRARSVATPLSTLDPIPRSLGASCQTAQEGARDGGLRKDGPVAYREADQEYFDKRELRRHAGVWSLWALGVAAVISGDFFGWNFGLA